VVVVSLVLLVQANCLTVEEILHKIKWKTLLLICGAYGLKIAFKITLLADFIGVTIVAFVGKQLLPIITLLYFLSTILGTVFPPKAEIGIMFPILVVIQKQTGLDIWPLLLVTLQGIQQLLTPVNPENNYVNTYHSYKFTDFAKLGAPLVVINGLITIFAIWFSYKDVPVKLH